MPLDLELFEHIAATSPDVLFVFDLKESRNVYVNSRVKAVLGYSTEEFTRAPVQGATGLAHPDDLPLIEEWLGSFGDATMADVRETEHRVRHADGTYRWLSVRAAVFKRAPDGRALQLVGTAHDITPRKEAALALQLSEERLRHSLDAGQLGAWDLDLLSGQAWRSLGHDRVFGYDELRPEWTYTTFLDHVLPEDRPTVDAAFQAALAGQDSWDVECRILRRDGVVRWIAPRGRVTRSGAGAPARMFGTVADVTERRANELALVEAATARDQERARLFGYLMQAPAMICVLSGPSHVFELVNPLFSKLVGDRELAGKPIRTALPELADQGVFELLDEVRRTGHPFVGVDVPIGLSSATSSKVRVYYFNVIYQPLRDARGEVESVLAHVMDVTAQVRGRKRLEAAFSAMSDQNERLTDAEALLRNVVDNQPELAWSARADGHIEFYNRRWYEYTGSTPEQMLGWGWKSVHRPDLLDAVVERWQRSLDTGEPFEMEFPIRGADGTFRWFLTRVRPLRGADGTILRWVGTNTDINDRVRDEELREMLHGVLGHDLRNPLNVVVTGSHLLQTYPDLPPGAVRTISRIVSSGKRMQRMIEQLLDLTRARSAGGIPVSPVATPASLPALVRALLEESKTTHPRCHIELQVSGNCMAAIDRDRFEQVVSNLLGNALAHGDTERPIRVSLNEQGDTVELCFHNYGRPIPPERIGKIFSPFERGADKRSADGLGLGLFIAASIVKAHGGEITVHSNETDGTRFVVTVPKREPHRLET